MVLISQRLYPLGKDYVTPVMFGASGAVHGFWGPRSKVTCCGLEFSKFPPPSQVGAGDRLTCVKCIAQLRSQGWDVKL